jgi:hypothetical protein
MSEGRVPEEYRPTAEIMTEVRRRLREGPVTFKSVADAVAGPPRWDGRTREGRAYSLALMRASYALLFDDEERGGGDLGPLVLACGSFMTAEHAERMLEELTGALEEARAEETRR